jgi:hypothetical protein
MVWRVAAKIASQKFSCSQTFKKPRIAALCKSFAYFILKMPENSLTFAIIDLSKF